VRSSKHKPADVEPLEKALAEIASALRAAGVSWMVIGGIASIARGVRRMTTDIDVVVRGDETTPAAMLHAFTTKRIVPRIADAEAFANERLVLLLRHEPTGVDLDLSFGWTTFEHEALEARSEAAYGSVVAPMARAEDLVIFKAMAARPKDIEDATALMLMHKEIDVARVRRHLAELAALADEPTLTSGLDAVIRLAAAARPSAPRAGQKRSARSLRTPKAKPPSPKATAKARSKDAPKPRRAKPRRSTGRAR
jgi:predicted nucleotidyltransferase